MERDSATGETGKELRMECLFKKKGGQDMTYTPQLGAVQHIDWTSITKQAVRKTCRLSTTSKELGDEIPGPRVDVGARMNDAANEKSSRWALFALSEQC